LALHGEVRKIDAHLPSTHFGGMAGAVETSISVCPSHVGLFRPTTEVPHPDGGTELIEECGHGEIVARGAARNSNGITRSRAAPVPKRFGHIMPEERANLVALDTYPRASRREWCGKATGEARYECVAM
jgi:hypothetical protein